MPSTTADSRFAYEKGPWAHEASRSTYAIRPRGWTHARRCLAAAIIAAVENLRDLNDGLDSEYQDILDHEFRIAMQQGDALEQADAYLRTGAAQCICPMGHKGL